MTSTRDGSRRVRTACAGALAAGVLGAVLTACAAPPQAALPGGTALPSRPLPAAASTAHSPLPALPGHAPAPAARCTGRDVAVTVGGTDAAMGLRALSVELVNCGTRPYRLNGYPVLQVLDGERRPLDVEVAEGSSSIALIDGFDAPPRPLTLAPGETAVAGLVWRNTLLGSTAPPARGAYLRIAPAEGRAAHTVRRTVDLGTTGRLGVTAWHRPRR
ncbi:DUF4232 domain-containing protein [Planomonospora alba]